MEVEPLSKISMLADTALPKHSPRSWQGLSDGLLARQMLPASVVLHQSDLTGTTRTRNIIASKRKKGFS